MAVTTKFSWYSEWYGLRSFIDAEWVNHLIPHRRCTPSLPNAPQSPSTSRQIPSTSSSSLPRHIHKNYFWQPRNWIFDHSHKVIWGSFQVALEGRCSFDGNKDEMWIMEWKKDINSDEQDSRRFSLAILLHHVSLLMLRFLFGLVNLDLLCA